MQPRLVTLKVRDLLVSYAFVPNILDTISWRTNVSGPVK